MLRSGSQTAASSSSVTPRAARAPFSTMCVSALLMSRAGPSTSGTAIFCSSESITRAVQRIFTRVSRSGLRWAGNGRQASMLSSEPSSKLVHCHDAHVPSTNAFRNLKALAGPGHIPATLSSPDNAGHKIKALGIPDCCICTSLHTDGTTPLYLTCPLRSLQRHHPSSTLYRSLFTHLPLQMHSSNPPSPPSLLHLSPLQNICRSR